MTRTVALLFTLLCGPFGSGQEPSPAWELDEDSLLVESARVLKLFAEPDGTPLAETVTIRLAESEEIAAVLGKELALQAAAMFPAESPAVTGSAAQSAADMLSNAMVAKYAWEEREVLVAAERFEELAERFDDPAILSVETLRAVLVHECVHALDHHRYDFPAEISELDSVEAIQSYAGVIEGHAQFQARRICREQGWSDGFETYTACIGRVPSDPNSVEGMIDQVIISDEVWMYRAGERFIAALHRHDGDEAIARAFDEPPSAPELIEHPEWYLDSKAKPEASCDLGAAIAVFLERYPEASEDDLKPDDQVVVASPDEQEIGPIMSEPEAGGEPAPETEFERFKPEHEEQLQPLEEKSEGETARIQEKSDGKSHWIHGEASLLAAQIRAALALLPADEVDRIVGSCVANRAAVVDRVGGSGAMVIAGLFEFSSEQGAGDYRQAGERLLRLKDQRITGVDILNSEYRDVAGSKWKGVMSTKQLEFLGESLVVRGIVVSREHLAVELMFSDEEITESELRELVEEMFAAAFGEKW